MEITHIVPVFQQYNVCKIPAELIELRKKRNNLIRENKIVQLTRKFKFDRYSFSRLSDNKIF